MILSLSIFVGENNAKAFPCLRTCNLDFILTEYQVSQCNGAETNLKWHFTTNLILKGNIIACEILQFKFGSRETLHPLRMLKYEYNNIADARTNLMLTYSEKATKFDEMFLLYLLMSKKEGNSVEFLWPSQKTST